MRDSILACGTQKTPQIVKLQNRPNPINGQHIALTNPFDFLIEKRGFLRTPARIAVPFAPKTIPLGSSAPRKLGSRTQRSVSHRVSQCVTESQLTHSVKRACTLYCKTNPPICCPEDAVKRSFPITDQQVKSCEPGSRQPCNVFYRESYCVVARLVPSC